jgi:hypothetical protein
VHQSLYEICSKKFGFGNWTTKINPIQRKLKDKNYRGHGKSCLRMENHANGMAYLHDFAMLALSNFG